MGPPLRSFAADAHDCIVVPVLGTYRIQGCGAIQPRPKAGSPPIVIPTASSCSWRDRTKNPTMEKMRHPAWLKKPHTRALVPSPKRSESPRATLTPEWWMAWKCLTLTAD